MRFWVAIVASLLVASPAQANWYQAESEHFVIYADDKEEDLFHFAQMLERYHSAMELLTGRETAKPSPSNRVTIFVLSEKEVTALYGGDNKYVAGFYQPNAGMTRAFVPPLPRARSRGEPEFSQTVLLHEYAHHFLMSTTRFGMPRWMNEGMAEFFASTKMERDDVLQIGRPANHRAAELQYSRDVSIRELLDDELYEKNRGKRHDAYYGRAWLLVHYLWFSEDRSGQLNAYWKAVSSGTGSLAAAEQVFGDLDQLENDMDDYLHKRRMLTYNLTPDMLPIGPVHVSALSEGLGEMMPVIAHSQSGVSRVEAIALLPEAEKIAARYPTDARVLAGLAEAEVDAGHYDKAIEVADAAIAIDPGIKNAHLQKAYALYRKAPDEEDQDQAYKRAMAAFGQLNRLENDHPLPLIYLYRSYVDRGRNPSDHAKVALEHAMELAPFDRNLAMTTGLMLAHDGQIGWARYALAPVATDPHGGQRAEMAQHVMSQIEGLAEGTHYRFQPPPPDVAASDGDDPAAQ